MEKLSPEQRRVTHPIRGQLVGKDKNLLLHLRAFHVDQLDEVNGGDIIWLNVSRHDTVRLFRFNLDGNLQRLSTATLARELRLDPEELEHHFRATWVDLRITQLTGTILPIMAYTEDYT